MSSVCVGKCRLLFFHVQDKNIEIGVVFATSLKSGSFVSLCVVRISPLILLYISLMYFCWETSLGFYCCRGSSLISFFYSFSLASCDCGNQTLQSFDCFGGFWFVVD